MRHLLRPTHLTVLLLLTSLLLVSGCDKKRMSYVDMIKQEEKEVKYFTDSLGIRIIKELPADLITPEGTFVEIKEGLFIRVVEKGTAVTGSQRIISARMEIEGIGPRISKESIKRMSNGGPYSGGTGALTFVYTAKGEDVVIDPNQDAQESANNNLQCEALLEAVRLAGVPSRVQVITSFRHGPIAFSKDGYALYFKDVRFEYKK